MKRLNKETWRDRFRRKFMQGFCKVENCHGCSADRREMEKIEKFLTRGVANIYPNKDFVKKQLLSGKKLKMYLGIDPTGPTLHMGHAVQLLKLKEFQELGHEVILLIGDFTARIPKS